MFISFHSFHMNFTSTIREEATDNGASTDLFGTNALQIAGAATGAGVVTASVMITATAAPLQVLGGGALAAGMYYAGCRKADGKSILPEFGKQDDKSATTETPAPAAAAA